MIRYGLLTAFVLGLIVVAVRRWYWSLCGLVLLTVVIQHPSFPSNMFGVQGLNPWNAVFIVVVISWLMNRAHEPGRAALSPRVLGLFAAYVLIVTGTALRAVVDANAFHTGARSWGEVLVEALINPLKYAMIGVMFFDGARTRARVRMALLAAVGSGICYALLVFKTIKLRVFTIDFSDARRLTDKLVGLYANDMAELLAFTLWAGLFVWLLLPRAWQRGVWLALIVLTVPPFLSLKSRAGYLACVVIGMTLGALRWRRILLLLPIVILVAVTVSPSVLERVTTGMGDTEGTDWDAVSAGRTTYLWPPTLEHIAQEPIWGHGRYAILREPAVYEQILELGGRVPGHPHNSYLEILLDAGIVGLLICAACIGGILWASLQLMQDRGDRLICTLGATGVIAVAAELAAGFAGSSFFPTQSAVPYVCVWGAVLGVHAEWAALRRRRSGAAAPAYLARAHGSRMGLRLT